jgi:hypothetical protein
MIASAVWHEFSALKTPHWPIYSRVGLKSTPRAVERFVAGTFRVYCRQPLTNRVTPELPVTRAESREAPMIQFQPDR